MAYYQQAIRFNPGDPDFHWNLARPCWRKEITHGVGGSSSGGSTAGTGLKREFREPQWDGSDLAGRTILLYAEGGFGDALHFVRYVPLVAQRGGRVILECQPELARLLRGVRASAQVVVRGESLPPFDVQTPLQSLPLAFGTTLATIPTDVPYLSATPSAWPPGAPGRKSTRPASKSGWSGRAAQKTLERNNPNCELGCFAPLAGVPGVSFYSLQKGPTADQVRHPPPGLRLIDLSRRPHRFRRDGRAADEPGPASSRWTPAWCTWRRPGQAGLDPAQLPARFSLARGSGRYAVVSHDAPLPPAKGRRLGERLRAYDSRAGEAVHQG